MKHPKTKNMKEKNIVQCLSRYMITIITKRRIPNELTPTPITLKQHNIPSQILLIYHKLESNHTKGGKKGPNNRPYKIK